MAVDGNDPRALDFRPRKRMTRWYEPIAMFRLVVRIWMTRNMSGQRERQPDQPTRVLDYDSTEGDFWFDYVADMGDGFDPTMAVAWQLGRVGLDRSDIDPRVHQAPEFLPPDDIPLPPPDDIPDHLPRGRLLVMGGDQVYPDATRARYRNQLVGPYDLAWETPEPGPEAGDGLHDGSPGGTDDGMNDGMNDGRAELMALPANHDWYGGSQPFRETFCAGSTIGGRQTVQDCTWWSARLAHGWWIWGVDTALDGTINQKQFDYFRAAKAEMAIDDRLIICTPVPQWRLRERHIDELDSLARFLLCIGVEPEVHLSGDYHVSAVHRRDLSDGRTEWNLTCGGGGAFQHPVHNLAHVIPGPDDDLPEPSVADGEPFHIVARWPSEEESRAGTGGWWDLLFDRAAYTLIATLAALQTAVMWLIGAGRRDETSNLRSVGETLVDHLVPFGALVSLVVIGLATFLLARSNSAARAAVAWARSVGFGHGVLQAGVFTAAALAGNLTIRDGAFAPVAAAWATLIGFAVLGSIASIIVLGSYLRFANRRYRMHDNESYSARASGDNRHFARFRIAPDGSLSCFVIAMPKTGRGWLQGLRGTGPLPPADASPPELIDVRFRTKPGVSVPVTPTPEPV